MSLIAQQHISHNLLLPCTSTLLLASLDAVPVFWRRPQSKNDKKNDNNGNEETVWARGLGKCLPFYVAIGGIWLAVEPSHWPLVLPIVFRRLFSRIVTDTWPRLIQNQMETTSYATASTKTAAKDITTYTVASEGKKTWAQILVDGGPLGPGCGKLIQSVVGVLVYAFGRAVVPQMNPGPTTTNMLMYCSLGSVLPNLWLPVTVLAVSVAVNAVLWLWSSTWQTRGHHEGVHRMVDPTMGRTLKGTEQVRLWTWALINAVCEEVTSRGLQRGEYHALLSTLLLSDQNNRRIPSQHDDRLNFLSNMGQALVFGVAHYHGIPSGWTGVGLTFVYGVIMGSIADAAGGGLFYPIVAHTVADAFIFIALARRKL